MDRLLYKQAIPFSSDKISKHGNFRQNLFQMPQSLNDKGTKWVNMLFGGDILNYIDIPEQHGLKIKCNVGAWEIYDSELYPFFGIKKDIWRDEGNTFIKLLDQNIEILSGKI